MSATKLPTGSFVRIDKPELQGVIDQLKASGYQVIGPQVSEAAVVYDELHSLEQLPIGVTDEQDGGTYRLTHHGGDAHFDYVVGPHSLKNYLFPPRETLVEGVRDDDGWQFTAAQTPDDPIAVIGPRACDLQALAVQDRVFLEGPYIDPAYQARRQSLFIVAVNCRRAVSTCFCHSMNSGPAVTFNFDLALTELDNCFVIEVGSERGARIIAATSWSPCSMADIQRAQSIPKELEQEMQERAGRALDTQDIHSLLMRNLDHPRWQTVAERCLSCANCTMVCPTCFCSSVEDTADLSGDHVKRERAWASCFMAEHSYMNSGNVRKSTKSRYRQWLTHKLATWQDQFGTSGCTGCGRCITWCPVGIDLTEEVAAIRGE